MNDSWLLASLIAVTVSPSIYLFVRYYLASHFAIPAGLLARCFFVGMAATLPVLLLAGLYASLFSLPETPLWRAFWRSSLLAAIPEEVVKFAALTLFCVPRLGIASRAAGIGMGAAVALGFATFENFLYVFDEGHWTGLLRAFTSVPCHAGLGAIMGYFVARSHFTRRRIDLMWALMTPIVIHTAYNFPLLVAGGQHFGAGFSFLALGLLILWVRLLLRRERRRDRLLSHHLYALVPALPEEHDWRRNIDRPTAPDGQVG